MGTDVFGSPTPLLQGPWYQVQPSLPARRIGASDDRTGMTRFLKLVDQQGGFNNQREALMLAAVVAPILNRTAAGQKVTRNQELLSLRTFCTPVQ